MSLSEQYALFGSTTPSTSPIGLEVKLPWRPCRCGTVVATIGASAGPHYASLRCGCGRHRGWVSADTFHFVNSVIDMFGRPDEPIVVTTNSRTSADIEL